MYRSVPLSQVFTYESHDAFQNSIFTEHHQADASFGYWFENVFID